MPGSSDSGAMRRDGPGGLPDGSLVYRFADGSRGARCLAQRLARGASVQYSIRDGPGVLPDGLLAVLRYRIRFETGPVSCPMSCSRCFSGWFSRGGSDVLPSGSLASVRFGGSFDAFGACQTARLTTASRVR